MTRLYAGRVIAQSMAAPQKPSTRAVSAHKSCGMWSNGGTAEQTMPKDTHTQSAEAQPHPISRVTNACSYLSSLGMAVTVSQLPCAIGYSNAGSIHMTIQSENSQTSAQAIIQLIPHHSGVLRKLNHQKKRRSRWVASANTGLNPDMFRLHIRKLELSEAEQISTTLNQCGYGHIQDQQLRATGVLYLPLHISLQSKGNKCLRHVFLHNVNTSHTKCGGVMDHHLHFPV